MKATTMFIALSLLAACGNDPGDEVVIDENNAASAGKADDFVPVSGTVRIDRMGHVEVGPLIIADMLVADAFNQEEPYGEKMSEEARAYYADSLQAGLVKYDNYDSFPMEVFDLDFDTLEHIRAAREDEPTDPSRLDWIDSLDTPHPLLDVYLTDALYIDLSKPCGEDNYLEPELAVLRDETPTSCGGRHINEDVIDTFATVLINGPYEREVHPDDDVDLEDVDPYPDRGDSVEEPARPASGQFPYLDEPYSRFLFN